MVGKAVGALVFLLLAALPIPAAEPPRSGNPVFDRAVQLVVDKFYDAAALDRFAEAVRREVEDPRSPVTATSSAARVDTAIDTVLDSLQASHTGHFKPDGIDYFELADIFREAIGDDMRRLFPPAGDVTYPGIGMIVKDVNGGLFVSQVYDGSPAARAGILTGDEILSIDGAPYSEIASFAGKAGRTVAVKLRRHAGAEPSNVNVEVALLRPLPMFEQAIDKSVAVFERDGRKIGYIRLWTLAAPSSMSRVAEALARGPLRDIDGLVLDLRGRWGGGDPDAAELFLGGTPPFRLIRRSGAEILANVRWHGPIVALVDGSARSGLEVFAYALKENGIALVGTRTAGALLGGRVFLMPDDSLLELAVTDAVIGDGVRLEGNGVQPDIPVAFNLTYAAGRDPQRDAAIEAMQHILARGQSKQPATASPRARPGTR